GVVYKARQVSLNRIVALKMILAGGHASEEDLTRFQIEGEAVAHLQHPNIVQIYHVGSRDGRPFFSLEYVDGGSLQNKLSAGPMPMREAARLIAVLARAMHHAHEKKIVHRDLKPANILLTTEGTPKITDFGLAKRLEDTGEQTGTGAILGTPTYMAPEQAQGRNKDIGPAVDVYALGAILYDLLTGKPPFRGETVLDTLQLVQFVEPVPPRRLQPKVSRDLETICLKCLEKEPSRRYPSAAALADDLERFLNGEPIKARPTPVWERVLKWVKRRPTAAALIGVSAAAVLALMVGGFVVADREHGLRLTAERQEAIAKKQKEEAERQRQRADGHLQQAFLAGDELLNRASKALANQPRLDTVRRDLLEKARRFYERFFEVEGDTPEVRWQTGLAHLRVGDIQEQFGEYGPALKSYDTSLALLRTLPEAFPTEARHLDALAGVNSNRANVLQALDRDAEAGTAYEEAMRVYRRLVWKSPEPRYQYLFAAASGGWAKRLERDGQHGEAEKVYREALTLLDKLCAADPGEPRYQALRARTATNLGVLALTQAPVRPKEALERALARAKEFLEQALAVQTKLASEFPDVPDYQADQGLTLLNLGLIADREGHPKAASKAYEQAAALLGVLVKEFPRRADSRHALALAYTNLGLVREAGKDIEGAEQVRKLARAEWQQLVQAAPTSPTYCRELALSQVDLGKYWRLTNELEKAEEVWAQVVKDQEKLIAEFPKSVEDRMNLARTLGDFGQLLVDRQQAKQAEEHYHRSIKLLDEVRVMTKTPPEGWLPQMVDSYHNLVAVLMQGRQLAKGVEALRELIRYQHAVLTQAPADAAQHARLASYYVGLLEALIQLRDHAGVSKCAAEYTALLGDMGKGGWRERLQTAALLARCVPFAEEDKAVPAAERPALARAYGDEAMRLLKEAVARGYRDRER
ncbi:MAG TPA: serine/threonine-protein kinase, partial [Gemmataceae bacterium]|nr:serine/threonine-protein kinase [Gemmataceae bacterium]